MLSIVLYILLAVLVAWVTFWNWQGYLLRTRSGHYAPRLTCAPQWVRFWVAKRAAKWFVGPVRIAGWNNVLPLKGKGRFIIAPNHRYMDDATLLGVGVEFRHVRFLIAQNQTQNFIKAPFLAWQGAIAVGYDKKGGTKLVVPAAVNCMVNEPDCILAMFPQGKLNKEDELKRNEFFGGVIKIARALYQETGQKVYIVGVVAQYVTDPSKATPFHARIRKMGLERFRLFHKRIPVYGANIYIPEPLCISDLSEDDTQAMDAYFDRMVETRKECRKLFGMGEEDAETGDSNQSENKDDGKH